MMCYKEEVLNRNSNEKKSNSLLRLLLAKILVIVFFKLNFKKFSISSVKGRCKSIYEFMEHDIWSLPTIFFFLLLMENTLALYAHLKGYTVLNLSIFF